MSPDDARDAARRKLGNPTRIREEIYRMNTIGFLDSALAGSPLRRAAAAAQSRRSPLVAILSLALGVGANTAIFQLLDAVRLRTLPVDRPATAGRDPHRRRAGGRTGQFSGRHPTLTNPLWERIRDRQQAFSEHVRLGHARRSI